MISLKNISVHFGAGTPAFRAALKDVSLSIQEGEFVTVIGSNGAGKSTLLNTVAGEVIPDSGHIWIDDEEVTQQGTNIRAKHVARVFQDPIAGTCSQSLFSKHIKAFKFRVRKSLRCINGDVVRRTTSGC